MAKQGRKILLIEDDPGDTVWLREQLAEVPDLSEVFVCGSLKEGLHAAVTGSFELVFLDLSLPDSSGVETVRRASAAFRHAPIIVLMDQEDEQLGPECLRAGAQDYFVKGRTSVEIISRVAHQAVERQRILHDTHTEVERLVHKRTAELTESVRSLEAEIHHLKLAERQMCKRAEHLKAVAGSLAVTEQRERRKMAQLLHDHLQQLLVGAKLQVSILRRTGNEKVKKAFGEIEDLLVQSINASVWLNAELSPPVLHSTGLAGGLRWLSKRMAEKYGMAFELVVECETPSLSDDVMVLLFESVRELLSNTARHAGVSSAAVNLRLIEGNVLEIVVSDAGVGFDPSLIEGTGGAAGGFGLRGVRDRLDLIDGKMEIESAPGCGSRFTLTVPIRNAQAPEM